MAARMTDIAIRAGPFAFTARLERAAAPETSARFEALLPYRERLIHRPVEWRGVLDPARKLRFRCRL